MLRTPASLATCSWNICLVAYTIAAPATGGHLSILSAERLRCCSSGRLGSWRLRSCMIRAQRSVLAIWANVLLFCRRGHAKGRIGCLLPRNLPSAPLYTAAAMCRQVLALCEIVICARSSAIPSAFVQLGRIVQERCRKASRLASALRKQFDRICTRIYRKSCVACADTGYVTYHVRY